MRRPRASPCGAASRIGSGSAKLKTDPLPASLVTPMEPPISSQISLQMLSPRPVPP